MQEFEIFFLPESTFREETWATSNQLTKQFPNRKPTACVLVFHCCCVRLVTCSKFQRISEYPLFDRDPIWNSKNIASAIDFHFGAFGPSIWQCNLLSSKSKSYKLRKENDKNSGASMMNSTFRRGN